MSFADHVVRGIFYAVVIPANLYALFYAFRPWYTTPQGRALMIKAAGNAILLDVIVASLWFGEDYPGRDVIRIVGFGLFTIGILYLLCSLIFSEGARRYPPWSWSRRSR